MRNRFEPDFREMDNASCLRCSNRDARRQHSPDGVCAAARSSLDGGLLRCVGEWGQEKAFYLLQYLGIFVPTMKRKWKGLNYIEICSGPGRSINFNSFVEHDGSAIAVLRHPSAINLESATFVDLDERVITQLRDRIVAEGANNARAEIADFADPTSIINALRDLPSGCLNLVFIDPTDLGFPFETLRFIVDHLENVDIVMTVAVGTDFNRNAHKALFLEDSPVRRKYEAFLGIPGFFDELTRSSGKPPWQFSINELRQVFSETFSKQLASLGYAYQDTRSIRHYYDLVFASSHPLGLKFWDQACRIDFGGQRRLF